MKLKELFLREDDRSIAVFAFGRFNPPTIGHQKLIETVLSTAEKANGKAYLFLSHKQNNKTDPLTFQEKQAYVQQFYPKLALGNPTANTIISPTFTSVLKRVLLPWIYFISLNMTRPDPSTAIS